MAEKETVIKTKELQKTYRLGRKNFVSALNGVDFELGKGDFVALVGPSGSGKSTFMHLVGLLQTPSAGKIWIKGEEMTEVSKRSYPRFRSENIGFVFQGFNLIPTLTAKENVMLSGRYAGMSHRLARDHAEELLAKFGLQDRMNHKPDELSGGQQQRVAIARALINSPAIILADEPTGELDSKTSREVVEMLKELNSSGQTILIVTHNTEVAKMAKKIVEMKDGRIV